MIWAVWMEVWVMRLIMETMLSPVSSNHLLGSWEAISDAVDLFCIDLTSCGQRDHFRLGLLGLDGFDVGEFG